MQNVLTYHIIRLVGLCFVVAIVFTIVSVRQYLKMQNRIKCPSINITVLVDAAEETCIMEQKEFESNVHQKIKDIFPDNLHLFKSIRPLLSVSEYARKTLREFVSEFEKHHGNLQFLKGSKRIEINKIRRWSKISMEHKKLCSFLQEADVDLDIENRIPKVLAPDYFNRQLNCSNTTIYLGANITGRWINNRNVTLRLSKSSDLTFFDMQRSFLQKFVKKRLPELTFRAQVGKLVPKKDCDLIHEGFKTTNFIGFYRYNMNDFDYLNCTMHSTVRFHFNFWPKTIPEVNNLIRHVPVSYFEYDFANDALSIIADRLRRSHYNLGFVTIQNYTGDIKRKFNVSKYIGNGPVKFISVLVDDFDAPLFVPMERVFDTLHPNVADLFFKEYARRLDYNFIRVFNQISKQGAEKFVSRYIQVFNKTNELKNLGLMGVSSIFLKSRYNCTINQTVICQ